MSALRLINPETGEVERSTCPDCNDLIAKLAAVERERNDAEADLRKYRTQINALKADRQKARDSHRQRRDIERVFELWKTKCLTRKSQAKLNAKRFDLLAGRLKEGYTIEHCELAVAGAATYPYVTKTGKEKREFEFIFADGNLLELFANRGAQAVREQKQRMEGCTDA